MNVTIKVKGLDDIIRNFHRVNVKKDFVDAANVSIAEVHRRALVEVPVRTSALQKSHQLSPATLHTARAEVYTNKEYAVPVHEGHRLVAWGRDTGRRIPPNKWMLRAAEKSQKTIESVFSKVADKITRELTR
jgi:hypothetical protein